MKTSTVTPSFYYVFNISLYCNDTIPSFIENPWRVLLPGNHLKLSCSCKTIRIIPRKHQKTYRCLTSCAFTIMLKYCQNKRLAFPNSAGFLPARLAPGISFSFSKTIAVEISTSLIAILELGILSSPASFSCSHTEAYLSGLRCMYLNLWYWSIHQ